MVVKTPEGGRDRTEGFHQERGGRSTRGILVEPYSGGLCPLHWDILGGSCGTCGSLERPKEG
jgi:hypothetical protein